jgi:hypothetical protein
MTGILLLITGIAGIIIYGYLVFFYENPTLILSITAFVGVALILAIVGWIGYTMATTPPPEPLDVSDTPEPEVPSEPDATETPKTETSKKPASKEEKPK